MLGLSEWSEEASTARSVLKSPHNENYVVWGAGGERECGGRRTVSRVLPEVGPMHKRFTRPC